LGIFHVLFDIIPDKIALWNIRRNLKYLPSIMR
jgi:hypothetical protein